MKQKSAVGPTSNSVRILLYSVMSYLLFIWLNVRSPSKALMLWIAQLVKNFALLWSKQGTERILLAENSDAFHHQQNVLWNTTARGCTPYRKITTTTTTISLFQSKYSLQSLCPQSATAIRGRYKRKKKILQIYIYLTFIFNIYFLPLVKQPASTCNSVWKRKTIFPPSAWIVQRRNPNVFSIIINYVAFVTRKCNIAPSEVEMFCTKCGLNKEDVLFTILHK